jgi:hypothetical protein
MTLRVTLPLLALVGAASLSTSATAGGFRAAANAACVRYARITSALPQITSTTELKRQLVLVPKLFGTMVDRIAATSAPLTQRAQAAQLVGSLRRVERVLRQISDAFLRGDQAGVAAAVRSGTAPSLVAARAARALDLPVCARLAREAAKGPQP